MFVWTRRMRFWQTHYFVFCQRRKIFSWKSENYQKNWLSPNMFFSSDWYSGDLERFFDYPVNFFCKKSQSFVRNTNSFKTGKNIKLNPWTRRMQFSKPCQNFSASSLEFQSAQSAKKVTVFFLSQKVSVIKMCLWTREMQFFWTTRLEFSHPCRTFSDKVRFFSLKIQKLTFSKIFYLFDPLRT